MKRKLLSLLLLTVFAVTNFSITNVMAVSETFNPYAENLISETNDAHCYTPDPSHPDWYCKGGFAAFTNIDFGEKGASKVKISLGGTDGGTSLTYVNVWLYDGDISTVKTPDTTGYLHDKDTGTDIGEKIATISTGQETNGWYTPAYVTVDLSRIVTGEHSIYIASPSGVNIYSIQFLQEEFEPYKENVLAKTNDATCYTPDESYPDWLCKGGVAAFTNVDFGETGAVKVKFGIGWSGTTSSPVRIWLYDGELSNVEITDAQTAKSGYLHDISGADIGENIATLPSGQTGNGWYTPTYITVDLTRTITGTHGIYVASSSLVNVYSIEFIQAEVEEPESPVYSEMNFTDTSIFKTYGYKVNENSLGNWAGTSYAKIEEIDFGEESPYSVTFKVDGAKSYNPNIYLWAFDSSVDTSGYSVSFGNVLDAQGNKLDSSKYCVAVLSDLPITGWNNAVSVTAKLTKAINGKKTIFVGTSSALNLHSMKFNNSNGLIFDLDLSAYESTDKTVINDVVGNESAITVSGSPVVKSMNVNDEKNNYLSFASMVGETIGNTDAGIKVVDDKFANMDEMSVEIWARAKYLDSDESYSLFQFSDLTNITAVSGVKIDKNKFTMLTNGENTSDYSVDMSANNKEWTHYVFTQKWDADNSEWDCDVYANGTNVLTFSDKADSRITETSNFLSIGNNGSFNRGFGGDIAEFRVYSQVLDVDDVKSRYDETVSDYPDYSIEITDGTYDEESEQIAFTFSEAVDITSAKLTVFDSNGRIIQTESEQKNSTSVIVSFPYGLPSDGEYTIDFENLTKVSDSSIVYCSSLFDATESEVSVYDIQFTDELGNTFENLDNVYTLNFDYKSKNTGKESVIAAQYADGRLIKSDFDTLENDGNLKINLYDTADEVRFFIWDMNSLRPLTKDMICERSDEWVPSERELTVSGDFYNADGEKVTYIENQSEIQAKLSLSASTPPDNLTAVLKLVRDDTESIVKSSDITFDSVGTAIAVLSYSCADTKEGDALLLEVISGQTIYYKKQIGYEDPSKTVDVLLIAGQSNAMGQYADATISIKPEKDTVYYGTMGNNALVDGEIGWAGSLGKTWHDETGRTVLVVKAAWGATGFSDNVNGYWNVDYEGTSPRDCYDTAKDMYQAAIESVRADSNYKLGNCVYFWLQGELENDNGYNAEQYTEPFLAMHEGFLSEFGTGDAALTHGGIIPVRARVDQGYPANLMLTGSRTAQYNLGKTREDLQVVSYATEHWYSDDSVASWFKKEYRNREYYGDSMPLTMAEILFTDKLHYRQQAHNEIGREAALSMLAYLNGGTYVNGISLVTPNGIVHYNDGDDIYLTEDSVIPVIDPKSGKKAEFTLSDNKTAAMDEFGVITAKAGLLNDYTTLTVSVDGQADMTFKLYSPLVDDSINIAEVKDNKSAIYTFVSDDGLYNSVSFFNDEFKRLGLRGTVAMVADWVDNPGAGEGYDYGTWDKWRALLGEGYFTAANHSLNHPTFVNQEKSVCEYQINTALEKLNEELPDQKILGVCAPGNVVNDTVREVVKEKHLSLRAGGADNTLPITEDSLYSVGFKTVTDTTTLDDMNAWVDTAIANNTWLMEMWHGVEDEGWSPPTKETATAHFEYVAGKNEDLWIADWNEVIVYAIQRLKSRITITSQTDSELLVKVTDSLDNEIFDSELTVNITLPDGWEDVDVQVNGKTEEFTMNDGILSVNIPADNAEIKVSKA